MRLLFSSLRVRATQDMHQLLPREQSERVRGLFVEGAGNRERCHQSWASMMSVTHNDVRSVKSNSCVGTDTNRLSFRALRTCRVVRTCTVRQVMRDDHRRGGGEGLASDNAHEANCRKAVNTYNFLRFVSQPSWVGSECSWFELSSLCTERRRQ